MQALRKASTVIVATGVFAALALVNAVPPSQAADVALAGYSGYTAETFAADSVAESLAHTALMASATNASVAGDFAEANGGDGGSGSPSCSVTTYKPRGFFDRETNTAHVEVTADVWCNFTSPKIVVKVMLQGYEGGRSVGQSGPDVTCPSSAVCTATATFARYIYCGEYFKFEHYGRPYGSFQLRNGSWRTLVGDGVAGPSAHGSAYRYC